MPAIYTIGHSTRPLEALIEILKAHGVQSLADVRRYPGSRRLPWFNAANFAEALPQAGIAYLPFPALGGRRRPASDSPNSGWRSASFRGYADYMQTREFTDALGLLISEARKVPTVIMCAEAVPWRCHRSLIADALILKGWQVRDILTAAPPAEHKLTPFLKAINGQPTYPHPDEPGSLFHQSS